MGREIAFQAGLAEHDQLLADYEIWPGRRLLDTTPEEWVATAGRWSEETQRAATGCLTTDPRSPSTRVGSSPT
ncbi:MAG: hypothetical protein M3332_16005 [Actinomycetota bacterium]|jgi:hypothetical protein|nr:hypothetical protein [Actinomycetota bacterium]